VHVTRQGSVVAVLLEPPEALGLDLLVMASDGSHFWGGADSGAQE
jgi:hypothetical protein